MSSTESDRCSHVTKDGITMTDQGCRSKGLRETHERMSVGDTISEQLDLQELNQGATGVQVTILQDGTVDWHSTLELTP